MCVSDLDLHCNHPSIDPLALTPARPLALLLRRAERQRLQAELDSTARTLQKDTAEFDRRAEEVRRQRDELEAQTRQLRAEMDDFDLEKAHLSHLAETLKARSAELVDFHAQVLFGPSFALCSFACLSLHSFAPSALRTIALSHSLLLRPFALSPLFCCCHPTRPLAQPTHTHLPTSAVIPLAPPLTRVSTHSRTHTHTRSHRLAPAWRRR